MQNDLKYPSLESFFKYHNLDFRIYMQLAIKGYSPQEIDHLFKAENYGGLIRAFSEKISCIDYSLLLSGIFIWPYQEGGIHWEHYSNLWKEYIDELDLKDPQWRSNPECQNEIQLFDVKNCAISKTHSITELEPNQQQVLFNNKVHDINDIKGNI